MNSNPYSVSEHQTTGDLHSLGLKFDQQLRVMQIIAVALMMSVMTFFLVVLVITGGEAFGQNGPTLITVFAGVFAGMMVVSHLVVPTVVAGAQLKALNNRLGDASSTQPKADGLVLIYQIQLIIALALLEGAAFFNLIALMIGKHFLSTLSVVALVALMMLKFPTKTKVSWWVQDRMRELP